MHYTINEGGKELKVLHSHSCPAPFTAHSTYDNVAISGVCLDRSGFYSGDIAIFYSTALTAQKTLSASISIKEAGAGEAFGSAIPLLTAEVIATASDTDGVYVFPVDLSEYKQYIQITTTLDLSHTATDKAQYSVALVKSGAVSIPTS